MDRELIIKKLIYQSAHRGCKETDALLGEFAKEFLPGFSDDEIKLYEQFINEPDWDIYNWMIGAEDFPEKYNCRFVDELMKFNRGKFSDI